MLSYIYETSSHNEVFSIWINTLRYNIQGKDKMMNTTEREIQLQKLKALQMINTYLSAGIIAMIGGVLYGVGWAVSQLLQYLI